MEKTLDAVEFPLSARVRGARRWLVATSAAGAVLVGTAVASVVADASGWVSVPRAIQAGLVLVTLLVLPVAWVGVHAVWALRGRAELFIAAGEHPRRRPTDRQLVNHLRNEHPLTPLWWMVSILSGLGTLCLGFALPFALADGAVVAGALLGTGLAVSLAALALAVSGIRRAARQGSEDRKRRAELWSLPTAVERRLMIPLLGGGDGAHLGA
ncbi:hypothetical protein ACGFY0_03015 [Streptomyces chartreusis]|uniref:hypothetical protein n=1 Tax=Streptomyces chartreusis TaxID=1969 RepID=UPI00371A98AF